MIQNPNVKVKNSSNKTVRFSGQVDSLKRIPLACDKKYLFVNVNTTAYTSNTIRVYVVKRGADANDPFKPVIDKCKAPSFIQIGSTGVINFMVEVPNDKDLDIILLNTSNTYDGTTSCNITTYDEDVLQDTDVSTSITQSSSSVPFTNILKKKYVRLDIKVTAIPATGYSRLYLINEGTTFSEDKLSKFYSSDGKSIGNVIFLNSIGTYTYYADIQNLSDFIIFHNPYINSSTFTCRATLTNNSDFVIVRDKKDVDASGLNKTVVFSGAVDSFKRIPIVCDRKYLFITANVTEYTNNPIRVYVVEKGANANNPFKPIVDFCKIPNYVELSGVFTVTYLVDIGYMKEVDILLFDVNGTYAGTTKCNINIYSKSELENVDSSTNFTQTASIINFINIFKKKWVRIDFKVTAIPASGESQISLINSGSTYDINKLSPFISSSGKYIDKTIFLNKLGEFTYYCDIQSLENFALYVRPYVASSTFTATVTLTNNVTIEDLLCTNDIVFDKIDFETFSLVKKELFTDSFAGYQIQNNTPSSLVLKKDTESVVINLNTILGSTLSMLNTGYYARILTKRVRGQQNYKKYVFVQLANKKAYSCEITSDIHAIETTSNWVESKFWEKQSTNRKIPVNDISLVDAHHRYDTTLPSSRYDYNTNGLTDNGLIQYQGIPDLYCLGGYARTSQMNAVAQYLTYDDRANLWATSDGGQNWVSMYDFSPYQLASETYSAYINTSAFADYSSGLTMRKVVRNIPSAENKEPATMWTITDMTLGGITKGTKTIITCTAHGLSSGDMVLFTGSLTDNEWSQLQSSGSSDSAIGDNVYYIEKINNDSFYLREYNGSYDTQLQCRHIHSVNETPSGFVFACGEEYPFGWIMFMEQLFKDAGDVVDLTGSQPYNNNISRLTSCDTSIQRCCGVLQMSNNINPDMLYFVDTSLALRNNTYTIDGRTSDTPRLSSNGIWGGKLAKIDNWLENECVQPLVEPSIWTYQCGRVIVCRMQLGGFIVSVDSGNTWEYIVEQSTKYLEFNGVKDNHICLGSGYEVIAKI